MAKRRRKKQPRSRRGGTPQRREPPVNVDKYLRRVENLVDHGRAQDAVDLLEPLVESHPRDAELYNYLGYARTATGDLWGALEAYEEAQRLSRSPELWFPLATLYLQLGSNAHALYAFRRVLRRPPDEAMVETVREAVADLELEIEMLSEDLGRTRDRVERGLRLLEDGRRALSDGEYLAAISANRKAIRVLGDWPPPHNNLSLALFYEGEPEKAIETALGVIDKHPENVQALSNAVRYLVWSDRKEEARALWQRLQAVVPEDADERLKMAEAAAAIEDDQAVYDLLRPLEDMDEIRTDIPGLGQRARIFLAMAEANLGRDTARRRVRRLLRDVPWLEATFEALKEGRPGPGWADRFPYYSPTAYLPEYRIEEFIALIGRGEEMPPDKFEQQVARFVKRFPQLVLMAETLIWVQMQPEVGLAILEFLDTPAAYAALRRFGLSQAGDDDDRLRALSLLAEAGEIDEEETLRVWLEGKWQETQIRGYEISDGRGWDHDPRAAELMTEGLMALEGGDTDRALELLGQARQLAPESKEIYNNLASVYARRKEYDQAQEMFRAALEIDPLYVFPRCNLAIFLLREDDLEGAIEMLAPLAQVRQFHPQEAAFYHYSQARVLLEQDEYDRAEESLEIALETWPEHELSTELLEWLRENRQAWERYEAWFEEYHQRDRRWRRRLQAKLDSPAPSLAEALPLYTKDALTGMARVVLPAGGWSALRKAELIEAIIDGLTDADHVASLVNGLSILGREGLDDEQRAALEMVLARGGQMPWQDFDEAYDNDLDESRYWQWHEPETVMGQLRLRGFLVEATVDDELLIAVPAELRPLLGQALEDDEE